MTGTITVEDCYIPMKDAIGTSNGCRGLVPVSLMMETHVDAVTGKTHDFCCCLIIAKHVTVFVNSCGVHIGRLSKDGTILSIIPNMREYL